MASTWFKNLPTWAKASLALSGGLIVGTAAYLALTRFDKRKTETNVSKVYKTVNGDKVVQPATAKRILVLGLSGSGKSSILSRFSKVEKENKEITPTDGFSVMCLQTAKGTFNIWEIGGTEKNRSYWDNFLQETDLLVFVVDSTSDVRQLDIAHAEFKKLLRDNKLKDVPILLLVNKQDVVGAKSQAEIENYFGLKAGKVEGHAVRVLGTRAPLNLPSHPSVGEAERMIISMSMSKR